MTMELIHTLDVIRKSFNGTSDRAVRSMYGQFLTPSKVADFMASLFQPGEKNIRLLDPGAGAGVLSASAVEFFLHQEDKPDSIEINAFETDEAILKHLEKTFSWCESRCAGKGVAFRGVIKTGDFISAATAEIQGGLFTAGGDQFTHVIMNPPYKKISKNSQAAKALYSSGIEVANMYAAFVWLSSLMLRPQGQLIAITPRSFCNGPYFRKFRAALLGRMNINHVHLFGSRGEVFGDDHVLQENIIFHAVRGGRKPKSVRISTSHGMDVTEGDISLIPYDRFVRPEDNDLFIHLGGEGNCGAPAEDIACLKATIKDMNLDVSTGRVVDFRAKDYLRAAHMHGTVPLIYPRNFVDGFVEPRGDGDKKPVAIVSAPETDEFLIDKGYYVLVKRFSSKEQKRRIMAAVFDPGKFKTGKIGFENHLNYFHENGKGLQPALAKGLALYLNSTIADRYFRQFSGHTQVNAADLRKMPYPTRDQILRLGRYVRNSMPGQEEIDDIILKECLNDGEQGAGKEG